MKNTETALRSIHRAVAESEAALAALRAAGEPAEATVSLEQAVKCLKATLFRLSADT